MTLAHYILIPLAALGLSVLLRLARARRVRRCLYLEAEAEAHRRVTGGLR